MWLFRVNVRQMIRYATVLLMLLTSCSRLSAETLQLAAFNGELQAWQADSEHAATLQSQDGSGFTTPLGSVWKLFVYSYLEANRIAENPYRCQGSNKEEVYCCNAGETIERSAALVQSCSLYFEPQRWHISEQQWRIFWKSAIPQSAWLQNLKAMTPATELPVADLLMALNTLPEQAKARDILLDTVVKGRARNVLPFTAAQLRVKTFSWHKNSNRVGGFAGWTQSGIPIWAMSSGTSATVFQHWPTTIADWSQKLTKISPTSKSAQPGCVDVHFFQRYPIKNIDQTNRLKGNVKVQFENGTQFSFNAGNGPLIENQKKISGRFTVNDYVARVIDREGAGEPHAAAQALAVVTRTYLMQNAAHEQDCLVIADSTNTQRVSAEPASSAALYAAHSTDGLVLDVPVQYHQTEQKPGQLSWKNAVALAENELQFDAILYQSFPQAQLKNSFTQTAECSRFSDGESFLQRWSKIWGAKLHTEPGYQAPGKVRVCRINGGRPYSDRNLNTIFVRDLKNLNDQITLAHEYCHLAFKYHPNTLNENYIESLARKLVMEP